MTSPTAPSKDWPSATEIKYMSAWVKAMALIDENYFLRRDGIREGLFQQREDVRKAGLKEREGVLYHPTLPDAQKDKLVAASRRKQEAHLEQSLATERRVIDANYAEETRKKQSITTPIISSIIDRQLTEFLPQLKALGYAEKIGNGDQVITLEELKKTLSYEGDIGLFKVDTNRNGEFSLGEIRHHLDKSLPPAPKPGTAVRSRVVRA